MFVGALPTAASIAAEADERRGLVVDMHTGRATVKRINAPKRADTDSTRSLKSFMMDNDLQADSPVSRQPSVEGQKSVNLSNAESASSNDENDGVLANLDNVDKPSSRPLTKDIAYQ